MMGLMFLLIGLIPAVTTTALAFALLYGISYFFTEFGPNTTTFIYPAEIFPTQVRTTAHGISAGAGKLGAFLGAFLFPDFLASSLGVRGRRSSPRSSPLAGMVLTIATLPEPKGQDPGAAQRRGDAAKVRRSRAWPTDSAGPDCRQRPN